MRKGVLIIMSKIPRVGRVKTRLAKDIGQVEALRLYKSILGMILMKLTKYKYWSTYFYTDTKIRTQRFKEWHRPFRCSAQLLVQIYGNLGKKMLYGLEKFSRGQPTIIIGGDIPEIKISYIREAFKKLAHFDVVFGPTTDGGFWLIGFANRRPFWRPLHKIRWSTDSSLMDAIERMKNRRICLIDELSDIDDIKSFKIWKHKI